MKPFDRCYSVAGKQVKGSVMSKFVQMIVGSLKSVWVRTGAALAVFVTAVALPAGALAVESEGAKKIKEVTTSVSGEGTEIILAVLGGLVALIALTIVLPKAVGFIRRFI